MIDFGEA